MSNTQNIERSIIASVLSSEIVHDINPYYFTNEFHRKLVKGINRLKELNEGIDFELLRNRFIKAKKWTIGEDTELMMIMTQTTPFASQELFHAYYRVLEKEYFNSFKNRIAI